VIAWDIVPFGVGLQGRPVRLLDRPCRTLFRTGGRRRAWLQLQHDENADREAKRDEEQEAIAAHEPVVRNRA